MDRIEELINRLTSKGWESRCHAAETLGEIGDTRAVEPLIHALKNNYTNVREKIAEALGKIGKPALMPLIHALDVGASHVRGYAARALVRIPDTRAVEPLIHALLNDENNDVRKETAKALGKIRDARAVEPLITALETYKNSSWRVRRHVIIALGEIGDPRAAKPLISQLKNLHGCREEAIEALGKLKTPEAVRPLIDALQDDDIRVRLKVITALGEINDHQAVEPIVKTLKHKNGAIRKSASGALDKMGWKPSNNNEMARYLAAKQEWTQLTALDKEAIKPLIHVLKDEEPGIREKAIESLGKIGDAGALEPLLHELKDEDSRVRSAAVLALGKIGDARAVEPLILFFKKEERNQENVINALEEIRSSVPDEDLFLFCSKCFHRCQKHKVKLSNFEVKISTIKTITYYACRNCHSNSYLIEGIKKVGLLLDRNFRRKYRQDADTFIVNWFKKKEPVDFDEIHIIDADDFDVEELVMKLKNDMDKKRRKRLSKIPVYLSPDLKLSQAKMNLLKDNLPLFLRVFVVS
jgi:HEAT repeat protein